MIRFSSCERCAMGRASTAGPFFVSDASENRCRAYAEGRVPSASTSSSHDRSAAMVAARHASQLRGWNQ